MNNGFAQKSMQFEWWGQTQLVGTLNPYLLLKAFKVYTLSGSWDTKTLGVNHGSPAQQATLSMQRIE